MKVIILQDIKGVGRKNEVKEVSVGYARNFLFPKRLAEAATGGALKKLVEEKAKTEKEKKELLITLEERKRKLEGMILRFKVKTLPAEGGGRESVFGSVSAKDIEDALKEKGMPNAEAELKKPLRELGGHQAAINLGEGIRTDVKVLIESD